MSAKCDYCLKNYADEKTRDIHHISCPEREVKEGRHPVLDDIDNCPGGLTCFYCDKDFKSSNSIKYHLLKSCKTRKESLEKKSTETGDKVALSFDEYCRDEFNRSRQRFRELERQNLELKALIAKLSRTHLQLSDLEHLDWFEDVEDAVANKSINLNLYFYENDTEKREQIEKLDADLAIIDATVAGEVEDDLIVDTYIGFARKGEAVLPREERRELARLLGLSPIDFSTKEGAERLREARRQARTRA